MFRYCQAARLPTIIAVLVFFRIRMLKQPSRGFADCAKIETVMSEYQYYEFLAIDRPLSAEDLAYV